MYFRSVPGVNSQLIQALAHVCHVRQKAYKVSAQVVLWSYVGEKLEIRKIVTNITKKEMRKEISPFSIYLYRVRERVFFSFGNLL